MVLEAAAAFKKAGTPGDMQVAMRRAYARAEVAFADEMSALDLPAGTVSYVCRVPYRGVQVDVKAMDSVVF